MNWIIHNPPKRFDEHENTKYEEHPESHRKLPLHYLAIPLKVLEDAFEVEGPHGDSFSLNARAANLLVYHFPQQRLNFVLFQIRIE